MLWKLRLFWYRSDKAAWLFAVYSACIVGLLVLALYAVVEHRDAQYRSVRDFHARNVACLARNIYYEARGEPLAGQYAVAEVTMNRTGSAFYPNTVCEVVHQKSAFSWTDLRALPVPGGEPWRRAQEVAEDVYYQRRAPTLPSALHYHATYVNPVWAKERERVAQLGRHVFYR